MGSWENFTEFDYESSLLDKLYYQRNGIQLFKLLLDSGFRFNSKNIIYLINNDFRKKHKYELINLLLEYGVDPYFLLKKISDDTDIHGLLNEHIQTIKNKQMLSFAKTKMDTTTVRKPNKLSQLDPDIFENITKYLQTKKVKPYVSTRYMLEKKQTGRGKKKLSIKKKR